MISAAKRPRHLSRAKAKRQVRGATLATIRRIIQRSSLIGLISFLGWSLVFGIVYAQSPLYTSNQNLYFLHGLARAGFGYLNRDWVASLPEAMPVFSGLVTLTYMLFHGKALFYLYYALVMGVYLWSMYGIMDMLFDLRRSKVRTLVFVALFLAAHSAALRFLLSRLVDVDATFLFEGGVAGQRILGQVFQPSVFGVFLVLSIYLFLRKKPYLSLLPMMVAIYVHPVYLLSGALLTLAYMWMTFRESRSLKPALYLGLTTLLLVLPPLAYAIYMFSDPSKEITRQALDILVNFRNPHHALISDWFNWTVVVQMLVLLTGLYIIRKTRLFPILVIITLGVVVLSVAQVASGSNWLALIFPWRVSILLVPTGTTILIAFAVTKIMDRLGDSRKVASWMIGGSLLLIAGLMSVGAIRFQIESARQQADPARPVEEYVAAHKLPGDLYMVLPKMTDFRLVTGAQIFVDFESTPDRDSDVLEWYRRIKLIDWFYNGSPHPCQTLKDMAAQEGITHAVVLSNDAFTWCKHFPVVYDDEVYRIYLLTPGK